MAKWLPERMNKLKRFQPANMKQPKRKKVQNALHAPNDKKQGFGFNVPGRTLVFETSGTTLYGAIASCSITSPLKLSTCVSSDNNNPTEAIAEVLAGLKEVTGKKWLPKSCILITPSAAGQLLSLPFDPADPRLQGQLGEMVRWELEELFLQQNDLWSLGALLTAKGYVTAEERYEIEKQGSANSSIAYGDLVGSAKLNECYSIQDKLLASDEELATGWVSQGVEDGAEGFSWYACGISDSVRRLWVGSFIKNKLRLKWIYPQLGTASALVNSEYEKWLLVDMRQEQVGFMQIHAGILYSASSILYGSAMITPGLVIDEINRLLDQDTATVFFSGPDMLVEDMVEIASRELAGRNVQVFILPQVKNDSDVPANILRSISGATSHNLRLADQSLLARIGGEEAKEPFWKRKGLYPWVVIVLLTIGAVAHDQWVRKEIKARQWALELAEIDYSKKMKIKSQALAIATEAKQLAAQLRAKEAELVEAKRLQNILDNVILYRLELVPGVLEAIAAAISDGVVLDLLEEGDDRLGIYLEGWSATDTEGQLFVNLLNEKLAPWLYRVENNILERSQKRMGIEGFNLKIWLKKIEPVKGNDA